MDTLLVVGCGDIARRALPALASRFAVTALVRPGRTLDPTRVPLAALATGDLDDPASLVALARGFDAAVHLAPPPNAGANDPRTESLLSVLASRPPRRLVYISTSGVYGDCGGARVDESRPVRPCTDRARRRVAAESAVTAFAQRHRIAHVVLRVPGIYAADRLPIDRLRRGTPVLRPEDDVYTNHVHADDLAAMVVRALAPDAATGTFNASDDSEITMGAWFDLIADRAGLPRPPRVSRIEATTLIPAPLLSFMSESRRLVNTRIKRELGVALTYPTVFEGVPMRIDPAVTPGSP